jgi:hypothetical protein
VDFIVGNPPFLGGNRIRQELGDAYVDTLFRHYAGRVPAFADLCCYWFEKARAHIEKGACKRAGLLATQGIRGGANRDGLKRIKQTGDIFWAISDKDWVLDGANVHVSLVAFDAGADDSHTLDGRPVATINPDLTATADITTAAILTENAGISFQGPSPKAPFGVLHSRIHEVWALELGTALEDRPRYTPTTSFETFPLPWSPGQEPTTDPRCAAIADVARELVAKRDAWLAGTDPGDKKPRTLTRLYNDRPTWLDLAHRTLDAAVCAAYGWPAEMSDEQILERLLALNLERGMTENCS